MREPLTRKQTTKAPSKGQAQDWASAKAAGLKTFHGAACVTCGGTERRTSNKNCVDCKRRRQRERREGRAPIQLPDYRQVALSAGLKRYHGKACPKCGTTERYTANKNCVECVSVAYAEAKERRTGTTFYGEICPKHPELKGLRRVKRRGVCVECNRERMRGEKFTAAAERWRENNPERFRAARHARAALRRVRKSAVDDGAHSRAFAKLSRRAKRLGMSIDHSVPIAPCRVCGAQGKHEPSNWQLLSPADNSSKGNRCMTCWKA